MVKISTAISLGSALAAASSFVGAVTPATQAQAFDGQYIHPNTSNDAVEWWWANAIGEPKGNNPPQAFQLMFYQGYPHSPRADGAPEYYITVNGFYSNGIAFDVTVPATSGDVVSKGEEVTGTWGGAGGFVTSGDLKTFTAKFDSDKLSGTATYTTNNKYHYACNTTSGPYFSSAVEGLSDLSPTEQILYNQLGWVVAVPGGVADIDVVINGSSLRFTGSGYHDADWAPTGLNQFISTWYFGSAQVGPYEMSYTSTSPVGSSPRVLNTGYLSKNGVVLQNQCSIEGSKKNDYSKITPYGSIVDNGITLPTGYILEYVLANGEEYSFNLTSSNWQNPNRASYHRWVGTASGGKEGESYEGLTTFEWGLPINH